ncbi:hypothetical protein [Embleya hyalina]|uniref:hypothetical protein n=1 Tax=Embleya hyalina TaxID=516124 RepID=UPI000F82E77D|nr:hypothetical protein [Embleya hyalina]
MAAAFEGVDAGLGTERALKAGALLPAVSVLERTAERILRRRVLTVVRCLERVVECYPDDPALRDFLGVPAVLHRWILRHDRRERPLVDFCRPDLVGANLGSVRVLEFNPSSPGGVMVAGSVNRMWRRSPAGAVLAEWSVPDTPMEQPTWFADWLVTHGRERGVSDAAAGRIALVRGRRQSRFEVEVMRAQFTARGRALIPVDADDDAALSEFALAYLKHIPADAAEVERWDGLCARLTAGDLIAPNVLAERWVAENKLCLAVMSDPRFRHLFTPAQHTALHALVPWSRKLGDGVSVAEAIAGRVDLVVKAPYGFRGQAVHMGVDTDPHTWAGLLRDPARRGWLVQERVAPSCVDTDGGRYMRDLKVAVLRGRVIGYGSRMGRNHVLNGALGSAMAAVFAPHTLDSD